MNVMQVHKSLGELMKQRPEMATANIVDLENPDYVISDLSYVREHDAVCIKFKEEEHDGTSN